MINSSSRNYIDFEVSNEQVGRWRYTGFYGFPEKRRSVDSWNLLKDLAQRSTLPWCIEGDFNDMVSMDEKRGGRPQAKFLLDSFLQTINECGLSDLGFIGEKFTWERFRGTDKWIQERLDRGLENSNWRELFPSAEVHVLEVSTSDHLPLCICLNKQVYQPKERRFRFENVWIKDNECRNIVQNCWNLVEGDDIVEKMLRCCAKLEEWGDGLVRDMRAKMDNCRKEMRKLRSRRDSNGVLQYNKVRWDYLCLLEKKEIFWKQSAKQFWLQEGDKNTRFFHKFASMRKEHNKIKKFKDANGDWK